MIVTMTAATPQEAVQAIALEARRQANSWEQASKGTSLKKQQAREMAYATMLRNFASFLDNIVVEPPKREGQTDAA